MSLLPDINKLNELYNQPTFVHKTQLQVLKDFNQLNIEIDESIRSEVYNLDQLVQIISAALESYNSLPGANFDQLFYTIDLPEKEIREIQQEEDFNEQLAFLIIKREAYKVYLRSKF